MGRIPMEWVRKIQDLRSICKYPRTPRDRSEDSWAESPSWVASSRAPHTEVVTGAVRKRRSYMRRDGGFVTTESTPIPGRPRHAPHVPQPDAIEPLLPPPGRPDRPGTDHREAIDCTPTPGGIRSWNVR